MPTKVDAQTLLHHEANLIEQIGQRLGDEITQAATMISTALRKGRRVWVCGNRASGALATAAGLDYNVYLPPGRKGDLLLVVMPEVAPPDLVGIVAAARERGSNAIALVAHDDSPLSGVVNLCLRVYSATPAEARLSMVGVLHAIGRLSTETDKDNSHARPSGDLPRP